MQHLNKIFLQITNVTPKGKRNAGGRRKNTLPTTNNHDDPTQQQTSSGHPIVISDEEDDMTSLTCGECGSILELTKSMFHDFVYSHTNVIDEYVVQKMREHFDYLETLKSHTGVQCQRIGKTQDWREFWPLKSKSIVTVVKETLNPTGTISLTKFEKSTNQKFNG